MKLQIQLTLAALVGTALLGSSCATAPQADADAQAVLRSSTDKIKAAQTVHVSGTRVSDPGLETPGHRPESATFDLSILRPGKLAYSISDENGTRRVIADGRNLTLADEKANIYDTLPSKGGNIDAVADEIEKIFDYEPIGLELLGSDPMGLLMDGVTSGKVVKDEKIGGSLCRHLSFTQPGLNWDLWIATSDQLPRKMVLVFTDTSGRPKRTVMMNQWTLNGSVPDANFVFTPRPGAQKADVIAAQ